MLSGLRKPRWSFWGFDEESLRGDQVEAVLISADPAGKCAEASVTVEGWGLWKCGGWLPDLSRTRMTFDWRGRAWLNLMGIWRVDPNLEYWENSTIQGKRTAMRSSLIFQEKLIDVVIYEIMWKLNQECPRASLNSLISTEPIMPS